MTCYNTNQRKKGDKNSCYVVYSESNPPRHNRETGLWFLCSAIPGTLLRPSSHSYSACFSSPQHPPVRSKVKTRQSPITPINSTISFPLSVFRLIPEFPILS